MVDTIGFEFTPLTNLVTSYMNKYDSWFDGKLREDQKKMREMVDDIMFESMALNIQTLMTPLIDKIQAFENTYLYFKDMYDKEKERKEYKSPGGVFKKDEY